jgi:aspartate aminotransferase
MKRINGVESDVQLAEYLIENSGIALVPGSAFGCEGYMRLSFATSDSNLEAALKRLASI